MIETTSNEDIQRTVLQAQQQFWSALKNKDRQAFERLLADDFIARSPGQPNQNRSEFIDTLVGFPARVQSIGSDNLEVHMWGEIAVITGVQSAQIEFADGQIKENRIAITNIFHGQQGHWILKFTHAISLD